MSTKDQFETAKKRFKLASDSDKKQRQRERDDLRFQVPELQWDDEARRQRLGTAAPGVPTPPRPILSVSKLEQPIRMITNQERNAHLGIQISPLTPDADDDTAEVLQDLYRAIERDSQASQARSWAFDRAVKCGRGWYQIVTRYDEYSEEGTDDQSICIERILHQEAVSIDPAATKMDFSDAEFAFVAAWVPVSKFRAMYKGKPVPTVDEFTPDEEGDEPDWVNEDGDQQAVRVVEYWFKEHTYSEDGKRDDCKVFVGKLSGLSWVEEPVEWNGKYIPLIPVIGRELQPFNDERRFDGIIGPNKDAQRMYNYLASNATEIVAMEPKAPQIGAEGQFEGHEAEWQAANVRNMPFLQYKPVMVGGTVLPPPQRSQVDTGKLSVTMMLLQQANEFLQTGTSQFDPSLGRTNGNEKSGKAIQALQQQGDQATSDFLANLADISLRYEAKVVLDLIPHIYDRPGRVARTLDEEDNTKAVMLNAPFTVDQQTGQPISVPVDEKTGEPILPLPPGTQTYDLSKGRYAVSVSVGRSRQSRMDSGAEEMGQILSTRPELMPILGDLYFRFRDFPGAREIADRLAKLRERDFPGLGSDEDEGQTLEQAQAENVRMKQQMQQMQMQLQEQGQIIETDGIKAQATLAGKQIDAQVKMATTTQTNDVKLAIAAMQDAEKRMEARMDMLIKLVQGQQADREAEKGRQHDKAMGEAEAGSAAGAQVQKAFADSIGRPLAADQGRV